MPSIYVESGVEEGACYGFPPGDVVFIVGRAPNSGIVITDPLVLSLIHISEPTRPY